MYSKVRISFKCIKNRFFLFVRTGTDQLSKYEEYKYELFENVYLYSV